MNEKLLYTFYLDYFIQENTILHSKNVFNDSLDAKNILSPNQSNYLTVVPYYIFIEFSFVKKHNTV